jgi:hypothetical protein
MLSVFHHSDDFEIHPDLSKSEDKHTRAVDILRMANEHQNSQDTNFVIHSTLSSS